MQTDIFGGFKINHVYENTIWCNYIIENLNYFLFRIIKNNQYWNFYVKETNEPYCLYMFNNLILTLYAELYFAFAVDINNKLINNSNNDNFYLVYLMQIALTPIFYIWLVFRQKKIALDVPQSLDNHMLMHESKYNDE